MAENILEEYLVKVGALPDLASFNRLHKMLFDTSKYVDNFATRTVKTFAGIELAIVGAFAATGLAMVSAADKAAMTDQSYRLLGLRMLMNKQSARAMQQALDQLGATIDEVAYDPELNRRFQYLYEQNIKLGKQLGQTYDQDMLRIRDLRQEWKRFSNEFTYIVWGSIAKTFEKLGLGQDDILKKLSDFNDWIVDNIPTIADKVSSRLVPVWEDVKVVLGDVGDVLKTVGTDFIHTIGIMSDDKDLEQAELNVDSLGSAFDHLANAMAKTVLTMDVYFKTIRHGGKAIGEGLLGSLESTPTIGGIQNPFFNPVAGGQHLQSAWSEAKEYGADVRAFFDPKYKNMMQLYGHHDFDSIVHLQNEIMMRQAKKERYLENALSDDDIDDLSAKYNVSSHFIRSLIKNESNWNPNAVSPKGAQGEMQVMPGTAKDMGFEPGSNEAGVKYAALMLSRYHGDYAKAAAAYNAGPGAVDKYHGIPPYKETQDYVRRVMRTFSSTKEPHAPQHTTINGGININVPHALPEKEWASFVRNVIRDHTDKNTKYVTAQTAGGAFH